MKQWESLCDGCGKCCLHKLEDEDTGVVYYTDVACRFLNIRTCRCKNYQQRESQVDDCLVLSPEDADEFYWLPATCAYRLLSEGRDLPGWHPLRYGSRRRMHDEGYSARERAIPERGDLDLESRIVEWPLDSD